MKDFPSRMLAQTKSGLCDKLAADNLDVCLPSKLRCMGEREREIDEHLQLFAVRYVDPKVFTS